MRWWNRLAMQIRMLCFRKDADAQLNDELHFHLEQQIAENRLDDALVTAKTMFAMSRHMGEHPTLIGELVAIAIAHVAIGPFEEMLEQPGCPNFYWALTSLPNPLVSLDKGVAGERTLTQSELRDLDESSPMTVEQVKKVAEHIDKLYSFDGNKKRKKTWENVKEKLAAIAYVPIGNSPDECAALIQGEMAKWGPIIKAAGLRAD